MGDKVKELMKELKIVKNDLKKYREDKSNQKDVTDVRKQKRLSEQMKILFKPISNRQKFKEINNKEYREMLKNQPLEKIKAKEQLVEKEDQANDKFLQDISKTMFEYADPIVIAERKFNKYKLKLKE